MLKGIYGKTAVLGMLFLPMITGGCKNAAVHKSLEDPGRDQVVIRIAWWGEQERNKVTQQVLDLYSAIHPEVVFETQSSSWDEYYERLLLDTARGQMPDLIQMDYQYITTYSENGSLADLTSFAEDGIIRTEGMDEDIINSGVIDGKLRGIAVGTSVLSIVYNQEVFDEAEIPYPDSDWTWEDFTDICMRIREATGKYGVGMTPILDLNLYHYWVRQQGEELFSTNQHGLGYEDDSIYVGYVEMFRELMAEGAIPTPDKWANISIRGEAGIPVVAGECGMAQEWNNFLVKMDDIGGNLKLVTPPLTEKSISPGLWMKPGMFFSIAETSSVKEECARFIDWLLNSREANEILQGERGVPVSKEIGDSLLMSEALSEVQREMFRFTDEAEKLCGKMPPPEPPGIDGINEAFAQTAKDCFYGVVTAEEAAARFREMVSEILKYERNRP